MKQAEYDAVVIGGGFFGGRLALFLRDHMEKVIILEKETDLLQRASYANQARVHNGYHYPRSILTAVRSRANFKRFVDEYQDCIDDSFQKYHAVSKSFSKVTARQFKSFCERIGADIQPAPKDVKNLFNRDLIEDVFQVEEYAFDAVKLKNKLVRELNEKGIEVKLDSKVIKLNSTEDSGIEVFYSIEDKNDCVTAKHVFNCTYSQINQILMPSNLPTIPLKHELTEIALIEPPEYFKNLGVTIMDGPFFSTMPFPPRSLHTLSHVRYTPHYSWQDSEECCMDANEDFKKIPRRTNFYRMIKDAQRYVPSLKNCKYVDSIWEVKTVLPSSEADDSRPILFKNDHGFQNLTCILGGKIDNIYDVLYEIEGLQAKGVLN
jgi:glycine/D-amino acid oxidase-like deaminating enzyme